MNTQLLDIKQVSEIVGLSPSTIWARVAGGEFPPAVRIGNRCTRWNRVEIEAWIRDLIADRDAKIEAAEAACAVGGGGA